MYVIRYKDLFDILPYQLLSAEERKRREVAFKHLIEPKKEKGKEKEKKSDDNLVFAAV